MATKKPTTKAKPKTTQAAKAPKKTVTKAVAKPSAAAKSTAKSRFSLRQINIVSAVTFVVLAVLAVVLMGNASYELTVTYLTADKLAGGIVPAYRHFLDAQYRWVLFATLLLAAVGPLMHATRLQKQYASAVKAKVMPWRWVEQGVLLALLGTITATLLGFQDITTLKLFAVAVFVVSLLSWYAEKELAANKATALRSNLFALIAAVATVLFMGFSLVFTYAYGQVRASWFAYAAFAVFALTLLITSMKQMKYLSGHKAYKNYEVYERDHLLVSVVSKLAFAVILIVGLAK